MSLLLTTVLAPVEPYGPGLDPLDLYSSRLTNGQDIFTFNHYSPPLGLHYIAQNILTPAIILEYPTEDRLRKELKNAYDVVGISFANATVDSALAICRIVRELSPDSKVVLGGYGVQCLNQELIPIKGTKGLFDAVCREEGVQFMRSYLDEPQDRPIISTLPPQVLYPFGAKFAGQPTGAIIVSFGCKYKCPFCATSAFFGHNELGMMSPADVVSQAREYLSLYPEMRYMGLFSENFLEERSYIEEIRRLVEEDPEIGFDRFSFGILSSVSNLSKYDADELVTYGIGAVWIGVESKFSKLAKRQGMDVKDLFDNLHAAGIQTLASFIIGLDQQSAENIEDDIDHFVSLGPTLTQVTAMVPGPGTELWNHLQKQGRLRMKSWNDQNSYSENMDYLNFRDGEVTHFLDETIRKLYQTLGPSVLRFVSVLCNGIERFGGSDDPRLKDRVSYYRRQLAESYIALPGVIRYGPNSAVREKAISEYARAKRILPASAFSDSLKAIALSGYFLYNRLRGHGKPGKISQPKFRRHIYAD